MLAKWLSRLRFYVKATDSQVPKTMNSVALSRPRTMSDNSIPKALAREDTVFPSVSEKTSSQRLSRKLDRLHLLRIP